MSSLSQPASARPLSWIRRGITYVVVFVLGLVIGFVPMWIQSRECANRAAEATNQAGLLRTDTALASAVAAQELTLATIQNSLASATIDAQRGDYEAARQAASGFFVALREEVNKGSDSSLSQRQKTEVEAVFARRDDTISLLARNDPAALEQLTDLYVSFREVLGR